jgi:hypothetical protein
MLVKELPLVPRENHVSSREAYALGVLSITKRKFPKSPVI